MGSYTLRGAASPAANWHDECASEHAFAGTTSAQATTRVGARYTPTPEMWMGGDDWPCIGFFTENENVTSVFASMSAATTSRRLPLWVDRAPWHV